LHRPYVFAFLAAFLAIGILNRGVGRTFLFLILGYSIAFLSEFSSIRNGFPYGMYHYLYENLEGELLLGGVPVWDSLSYSFLAYASYETAVFFIGRIGLIRLIGPILMLFLDVVVDPLAVRGDRWFLGKIFYYPEGGIYFGVPLSNFFGWFLVALTIFGCYSFLEKRLFRSPPPLRKPILGPLFYGGILIFNLAITFRIGEFLLGLVGVALHLTSAAVLFALARRR
jgi:putative membrane protein